MNDNPEPLSISNLHFAYPDSTWTLEIDRFAMRRGEFIAVIGPNGSGKSTLLRLAAGVQKFDKGRIEIEGSDIRKLDRRAVAKILGYLPQSALYEFDHRVYNVAGMGRYTHLKMGGFMRESDLRVIDDCLRQTGTFALRNRRLSQLSGGERQRVLLASILAQEPSILLLDEPANALDLHHQVRFFEILTRLARSGLSVAVVMHDLNFASLYCERIVLMNEGRILQDGAPDRVLKREILETVYGCDILLAQHPQTGRPVVFPRMEDRTC